MRKNKSIEFYRFALCIAVLLLHIGSSTALMGSKFSYGGFAVECYFVLSGFFLGKSIEKVQVNGVIRTSWERLVKQFIHIMPYYYICLFLTFIYKVSIYIRYYEFSRDQWVQFISNFFAEFFMVTGISYRSFHVNGPDWYVSALLISSFVITVIYLFLKKSFKNGAKYMAAISGIAFVVYMLLPQLSNINDNLIRAIANMLLGIFLYHVYMLCEKYINEWSIYVHDIVEIICLVCLLMCFVPSVEIDRRFIAVFFGILIIIQMVGKSHLSQILNNDFSVFLGRISLPVYLGQMLVICKFAFEPNYDITMHRQVAYIFICVATLLWALILELIISFIKEKVKGTHMCFSISMPKIILIGSILLFLLSFSNEQVFFDFSNMQFENIVLYVICKVLLLLIEVAVPQLCYKYALKNKQWIKLFVCVLSIYVICLLLSWPGNWNNDEFLILGNIQHFSIQYHQSFFTSIFYILALMIYPNCGSIIFWQMVICACIATYIIKWAYNRYGKIAYAFLILFLSPPTIYYLLYPLRVCLYAFSFLLLLFMIFRIAHEQNVSWKDLVLIAVLTAVVSAWRTESKILILVIPILVAIKIRKNISKKYILYFLIATYLPFAVFSRVNSLGDKQTEQTATLWSFVTGLSVMLQDSDIDSPHLQEDLYNIDQIMHIEKMKENANACDLYAVYNEIGPFEFTDDEYKLCLKSIARLIICNPVKYAEAKFPLFKDSVGLNKSSWWLSTPVTKEEAFCITEMYGVSDTILKIYNPMNNTCREAFVWYLTGMHAINETGTMARIYMWNLWLPLILLVVATFVLLIKRKVYVAISSLLVVGELCIVYLTAPSMNVMYFWPFYLLGYSIFFYTILEHYKQKIASIKIGVKESER